MKNPFWESRSRRAILSAALAACLVLGAVGAQAADKKPAAPKKVTAAQQSAPQSAPCDRVDMGPTINVTVGKSTLVKLQTPITRIVLGNPDLGRAARPIEIETTLEQARGGAARPAAETNRPGVADVDVVLLSPQEIYLLGKTVGSTNFVLVDRSGQCTVMDVIVGMDTAPWTSWSFAACREYARGRSTAAGNARSQGGRSLEGAGGQAGREPEAATNQWRLDL